MKIIFLISMISYLVVYGGAGFSFNDYGGVGVSKTFDVTEYGAYGGVGVSNKFDVTGYGAVGDGETDDSDAFLQAWKTMCDALEDEKILQIPFNKTFLLQGSVSFKGPCSNVTVWILGNIIAPKKSEWQVCKEDKWIRFANVDGLHINGTGLIDGHGEEWWNKDIDLHYQENDCKAPTIISFHECQNVEVHGLRTLNSPKNHITIHNVAGATLSNLNLTAPEWSPNTDGIDISSSTRIQIINSNIATGDDCIAMNNGTSYINISNVTCGPGHGISVGSLGENGADDTVEDVYVLNCSFTGTKNGVRIKTWPGGMGYARNIKFENITLDNVRNPIIIDQHYCNGHHNCKEEASSVAVSYVKYHGVHGTSNRSLAIVLNCSEAVPCTDIVMENIDIVSLDPDNEVYANCINVEGLALNVTPQVPCLEEGNCEGTAPVPSTMESLETLQIEIFA